MSVYDKEKRYKGAAPLCTHAYLLPQVFALCGPLGPEVRVLDVGCGNGAMAGEFLRAGCQVIGIDLSEQGVEIARQAYPEGRFEVMAADDGIMQRLGCEPFDLVVSTEVVEHLYDPRAFVRGCFAATKSGGRFICSTPYNGYLKNLGIALLGKFDKHANPLWDGGHIKLWSRSTLGTLMTEAGFTHLQFKGAGRLPYLWKSMVMSGDKP
ncbi:MAG: class I SAM-dependent methyltransferase [Tepidisphaeraceae bacterium]|jgi:2-polyprenyl-6-hydroxyphenyl methylase/3-demethylubiquinone-9 3-methyltransferase